MAANIWVCVRDESTDHVLDARVKLSSVIALEHPEHLQASLCLRHVGRYWWYDETIPAMFYLTPAR